MQSAKNSQNVEFSIVLGDYKGLISVPRQTTVAGLLNIVRGLTTIHEEYGPSQSHFIGLCSSTNSPTLDYWLSQPQLNFSQFRRKVEVRGVYSQGGTGQERLSVNDFQFLRCLGKGACGDVYLVRSRATGLLFAMKRIRKENIDGYRSLQTLIREKNILSSLGSNPHTVTFHASFESSSHINFLMDYYPGGELFLHLTNKHRPKLTEDQVKVYFCEIMLAMEYLHRCHILYRDLKNILVDIQGHLKIADFGLSKSNFAEEDCAVSVCGSPEYMAPEIIDNKEYNFSADFYSLGALLFELLTGYPPYYRQAEGDEEERLQLMWNMSLNLEAVTPDPHLRALLYNLLHADPAKRISNYQEIKNSPWLALADWKAIEAKTTTMPFAPDPYGVYIGKEFVDLHEEVESMNGYDDDHFDKELEKILYYVHPESRRLLGLCRSKGDSLRHERSGVDSLRQERSKGDSLKDGKKKPFAKKPCKGRTNISISLYEKEESVVTNASTEIKAHKNDRDKENTLKRDTSKNKLLSKQTSTANLSKQSSTTNLFKPCALKQPLKQTINNFANLQSQIISKLQEGTKVTEPKRVKESSRGKSKEKSVAKDKNKKKEEKRTLLPTCSYKIKLT